MTTTLNEITTPVVQMPRPEFVRMPTPGTVCPWCGLKRSHLYRLAKEGRIKTISLRRRGTARGVKIIRLDSVIDYLSKMEAEQSAESVVES
jgi:hypothetical protein